MNLLQFEQKCYSLYDDLYTADHPHDRSLLSICQHVEGMATENKLMLLNVAASLLEYDEVYLEVGSWKGLSLIGAMMGNQEKTFFAIEDFSEFGGTRDELLANLDRYQLTNKVALIHKDCFEVFQTDFLGSRKVGVFFYDGDHRYASQYRALKEIEPFLADEALIIIDDTSHPRVRAAHNHFVRYHPHFRLLLDIPSEYAGEPRWWNGIQVYAFRRQLVAAKSNGLVEMVRFRVFHAWYDFVIWHTTSLVKWIRWVVRRGIIRFTSISHHM